MNHCLESAYWMAVAHLPRWTVGKINLLTIKVIHEHKLSWADFFAWDKKAWKSQFDLNDKELLDLDSAKNDLPRLAFIAEQLQSEGFQTIPINSPDYPPVLKENLKINNSPPLLYIKGRTSLLHEDAVAIVGSRKAGKQAIAFTDAVAKKSAREAKVVVSGFAKGVDKQALDSTLEAKGKSIIVLPQGILTFQSGFKKYYQPIVNGDVLVLSTFFPKANWAVGLAMARNAYIYGLAKEIFVAESDSKGGTWQGVVNGLKRGRKIYVRKPEPPEKNANLQLIALGALPVNMCGETTDSVPKGAVGNNVISSETNCVKPTPIAEDEILIIEKKILELLSKGAFSSSEIKLALNLDWQSNKLTAFLKRNPNVRRVAGKPARFTRADAITPTLF